MAAVWGITAWLAPRTLISMITPRIEIRICTAREKYTNTESWTRWRYVPLTDAAGNPQTLGWQGVKTLRLTANEVRRAITTAVNMGDLQMNWLLFVPTPSAPSSGPWIASARPSKNSANFNP